MNEGEIKRDAAALATIVRTDYLPRFRKDIDESDSPEDIKELLEKRYAEVEALCDKYLED